MDVTRMVNVVCAVLLGIAALAAAAQIMLRQPVPAAAPPERGVYAELQRGEG